MQQQEMNASLTLTLAKLFPKELFANYSVHSIVTKTAADKSLATVYLSSLLHPGYCIVWVFNVNGKHLHGTACSTFCFSSCCAEPFEGIELASTHFLKPPDAQELAHEVFPDIMLPPTKLQV